MKTVLCGVLYSGEVQFSDCIQSILEQEEVIVSYFVIKGKPNKEAHALLYERFSIETASEYCLKIDADMVLANSKVLSNTLKKFENHPPVSHFICGVLDFFSSKVIHGIHFFKRGHEFKRVEDNLFVDDVNVASTKSLVSQADFVAFHSFSPTSSQCFHYGIHKACKALQRNSHLLNERASGSHLRKIRGMAKVLFTKFSYEHYCALLGSYRIFSKSLDEKSIDYNFYSSNEIFESFGAIRDIRDLYGFLMFLKKIALNNDKNLLEQIKSFRNA